MNVVPMDAERVLANQTVLIEGGQITALGPTTKVSVPTGAVRINGRGKYLIPGLVDMHTHFLTSVKVDEDERDYRLFGFLASGITTIRNTNIVSAAEVQRYGRDKIAEERLGPHIYFAGSMRAFQSPNLPPSDVAAAYKNAGYHYFTPESDSLMAAAHNLGLPVGTHDHGLSFEQMLTLGTYGGSADHLYAFWGHELWDSLKHEKTDRSELQIRTLAAAAQRAGVWIVPTLNCIEGNLPSPSSTAPTRVKVMRQLVKALQDVGAGLLLAGDDGGDVHDELMALVRAGLTPYQALLTGTRNVAQHFGTLDSNGTVAVGKWADLVLLYGNPLTDIRHTREPAGVMMGGRWFDRAALDQRLLSPMKTWIRLAADPPGFGQGRAAFIRGGVPHATRRNLLAKVKEFEDLVDSLELAVPTSKERVLRLQAEVLGAMRAILPPKQYEIFDPVARVWIREHARMGHPIAVSGVRPTP